MTATDAFAARMNAMLVDMLNWLHVNAIDILIAAAIGTLLVSVMLYVRRHLRRMGEGRPGSVAAIVGHLAGKTQLWFMVLVAARLLSEGLNPPPRVEAFIGNLFTIAFALQVAIWARELVIGLIERRAARNQDELGTFGSAMGIIRLLVSFSVFAIALIVILDNLGVNVTGLVAGLGVGGIAIGLAAQGIFSDLFAALSILFDKPFRKGDAISWDQTSGTVEEIGLKTTRVRANAGEEVVISNANLLNKEIHNTARIDRRRMSLAIGVIYQTSPDVVEQLPDILRAAVESVPRCTLVRAGLVNFAASSIDFDVQFDIHSSVYDEVFQARHQIGVAILKALNGRGIEFAYPTQTSFTAAPNGELIMPYPADGMQLPDADPGAPPRPEPSVG